MHASNGTQLSTDAEAHGQDSVLYVEGSPDETMHEPGVRELQRFRAVEKVPVREPHRCIEGVCACSNRSLNF